MLCQVLRRREIHRAFGGKT